MRARPLSASVFLPRSTLLPSSRTTSGMAMCDLARGGDDAVGDHVAVHDAAEDVDQDALHLRVAEDDLEGRGDLLLGGAAADVEEVRGLAAVELDDVHGGHGEAGAVHQAGDVAVELDVVEPVLGGRDFGGILLVLSRIAAMSGCRKSALSSKLIFASSAMSLPSLVTTSGLISTRLAPCRGTACRARATSLAHAWPARPRARAQTAILRRW